MLDAPCVGKETSMFYAKQHPPVVGRENHDMDKVWSRAFITDLLTQALNSFA